LAAVGLCISGPAAATPARITAAFDPAQTFTLPGGVHPLLRNATDLGRMDADQSLSNVSIHFQRSTQQQAELEALLTAQQTPGSPEWHQWLSPQQFGARFGLADSDLRRIEGWLRGQGLRVTEIAPSHARISVSGSVAQIERAFGVEMHRYHVDGVEHYASAVEPHLPAALDGLVLAVRNLHDFHPKPHAIVRHPASAPTPQFTANDGTTHYLAPDDVATIYDIQPLYGNKVDGSNVKIAVVGQTDIQLSDIEAFRKASSLPVNDPQKVLVPNTGPSVITTNFDDVTESDTDLEWAGAVAPKATIEFVYSGGSGSVDDALNYAIEQNLAPIISTSYGLCETQVLTGDFNAFQTLAQQANAQGQTIAAASGDSGAADCETHGSSSTLAATTGLAVDFPAALAEVTGVGGTQFSADLTSPATYWSATNNGKSGSVSKYIPESAWNESSAAGLLAGGGGVSKKVAKPTWQSGPGVPADGQRDVPDIALDAAVDHDGYLLCATDSHDSSAVPACTTGYADSNNALLLVGGTSVAAPVFAGMLALMEQSVGSSGEGNVNPRLYSLASDATNYAKAFHDVTSGNNAVPCQSGTTDCTGTTTAIGYDAGSGYDLATGLGSIDTFQLAQLIGVGPIVTTTTQLTVDPNRVQVGGWTTLTANIVPAAVGNTAVTGTVQFAVDGTAVGNPITVVNKQATLKITLYNLGIHSISATYSGNPNYAISSISESVSVLSAPPAQDSKDGGGGSIPPVMLTALAAMGALRRRLRRKA
jgi:subtilase family serine protease